MKNNKNAVLHVWMLPLLFVLACFTACYLAGSLDYRSIIDERSQRDFNAALGMPLIIGYLWLTLRILHRRSGKRIADFLVQANQLSQYGQHMKTLEKKLIRHVILAATLSIAITLVYLISEDLLAFNQPFSVLLLNVIAVPFWFFLFLFLMQSASFTRYLYNRLVLPNIHQHFCYCKPICDLGVSNVIFSLFMLLLIPVFWIGKSVPFIDGLILSATTAFMIVLLFLPVFKTVYLMRKHRNQSIQQIEGQLASLIMKGRDNPGVNSGDVLYQLNQQLEDLRQHRCWPKDGLVNTKVIIMSTGLPCCFLVLIWWLI